MTLLLWALLFCNTAFAQFTDYSAIRLMWDHVPEIDASSPITYVVYVRIDGNEATERAKSQSNTIDLALADLGVNASTKQLCFAIQSTRNSLQSNRSEYTCVGSLPPSAPGSAVIEFIP